MTNVNLLKSKLVLIGHSDCTAALSLILGISYGTASAKLNNKSEFKQNEIAILTLKLGLSADEVKEIFVSGVDQDES